MPFRARPAGWRRGLPGSVLNSLVALPIAWCLLVATGGAEPEWAWRRYEFVNPRYLEIRLRPNKLEMPAGETATFTLTVRNKTDKPVAIDFPTGKHHDLAVYHWKTEIFRWSQYHRLRWRESPHRVWLQPGMILSYDMAWEANDHTQRPLPQGIYRAVGILTTGPRHHLSNHASIRLTPPVRTHEVITVKRGKPFEIRLPTQLNGKNVFWKPYFDYNDMRIGVMGGRTEGNEHVVVLMPKRVGHCVTHFLGYRPYHGTNFALERRTFRVEIVPYDPYPKKPTVARAPAVATSGPELDPFGAANSGTDFGTTFDGSGAGSGTGSGSASGPRPGGGGGSSVPLDPEPGTDTGTGAGGGSEPAPDEPVPETTE